MRFAPAFLSLTLSFAILPLTAQTPPLPPKPPSAPALLPSPPQPPQPPPLDDRHGRHAHSLEMLASTGTCSDFGNRFGTEVTANAQQDLTYSGGALAVQSQNGAVIVRKAGSNTFGVTACKAAGGIDKAAADAVLGQINVQESNGKVTATGPSGSQWAVDLIVTVPEGRAISVRAENGPVTFSGVSANVDASVTNGPLTLRESRGELKASAINGPVSLSHVSGNVTVSTQNGPMSIDLDGSSWNGGELHAKAGNGPLRLIVPSGYQSGIALEVNGRAPFHCSGAICGELKNQIVPEDFKATLGNAPTRIFVTGGNGPVTVKEQ